MSARADCDLSLFVQFVMSLTRTVTVVENIIVSPIVYKPTFTRSVSLSETRTTQEESLHYHF